MSNANIVFDTPMVDYGVVLSYYVYGCQFVKGLFNLYPSKIDKWEKWFLFCKYNRKLHVVTDEMIKSTVLPRCCCCCYLLLVLLWFFGYLFVIDFILE